MSENKPSLAIVKYFTPDNAPTHAGSYCETTDGRIWRPVEPFETARGIREGDIISLGD